MTLVRAVLAAATLAALAAARPAAASTSLGLGADYLVDPSSGELQLTLAADTQLVRHATIGVRFGAAFLNDPNRFGVPVDARLRISGSRLYAEGLVGPWLVFDSGDTVRMHAAFGFGLLTKSLSFGVEVGWLDPTSMIGLRLAFRI
jgi:hypothetical protein